MKGKGRSSYVFQMRLSAPEYFNLNFELAYLVLTNWLGLFTIATKVGNFSLLFSENLNLLDLFSCC